MTWLGKSGKVAEGQTRVNKAKTVGNYVPGGGTARAEAPRQKCAWHVQGTVRKPVELQWSKQGETRKFPRSKASEII